MDKTLSGLGRRVFVMNNVHDERPLVFQTRWTLSYLRGPLTREQIQTLMASRKQAMASGSHSPATTAVLTGSSSSSTTASTSGLNTTGSRPVVPPDVPVFFVPRREPVDPGESLLYRPALLGVARLHYADKKAGVDHWETVALLQRIGDEMPAEVWAQSETYDDGVPELDKSPDAEARFAPMPSELARAKSYAEWTKALKNYLYRERTMDLWSYSEFKELSRPRESEREFRLRLAQASRERRDREVEKLRAKYAPKQAALEDQMRRARERVEREQAQASRSTWDATVAMGSSVLGALLGRKTLSKSNVTKAASAAKAAGRAAQQHSDVSQAEESLDALRRKYDELETKFRAEAAKLDAPLRPEAAKLEPLPIRPKKADITVEQVVLAWTPWKVGAEGKTEAAY